MYARIFRVELASPALSHQGKINTKYAVINNYIDVSR